jgi:PAS domain S-box-containing protein
VDRLLDLFDQTSKGLISFLKSGEINFASASFTEITGYTFHDFPTEDVWKKAVFPDPIYRDLLASLWKEREVDLKSQGSRKAPDIQARVLCKDNVYKEIHLTKITQPEMVTFLLEDVTEQTRVKEKLAESENTLRLFVENSPAALAMLDRELRYIVVSKRWYADYDLSAKDVIGKRHYDIFPDIPGRWKEIHAKCLTGVVDKSEEDFFERANGEIVWLKWEIQPWYLASGVVGGLIFLTDVVTNQKLAAKAIEESEANFRTILQTTDTAYLLLDKDLKVKSFNELAGKYSRALFNHETKIGDYLPDCVSSNRKEAIRDRLHQVLNGMTVEYVIGMPTDDGKGMWIFNRFLPIIGVDKKLLGVMIATRDISDQKREELQRERLMSDLIQHNRELEQFTYIVSHNLRAPVTNIISIVDTLSDDTFSPEDKSQFQSFLLDSANKLDEIIRDLSFVLKSKKEYAEQREFIDLNDILSQITSNLEEVIKKSKVVISIDFSQAPRFNTVRSALYTILSNLISNCIKFRDLSRDPIIKISSLKEGDFVVITISDNGQGIDLNKHGDQIFGLYKRFHLSTEGKGIGLYLVKSLIESLGGRINLLSKLNQGTEITLRFPQNIVG